MRILFLLVILCAVLPAYAIELTKGWCASPSYDWVFFTSSQGCKQNRGQLYNQIHQAEIEFKRLENCSSSSISKGLVSSLLGDDEWVWCTTKFGVSGVKLATCRNRSGKAYKNKAQAQAERKRQRDCVSGSTFTVQSPSSLEKIWCATKNEVTYISRSRCTTKQGKSYSYEHQAKAEHKRLKGSEYVWCATKSSAVKIQRSSCDNRNGKAFSSQYQAKAEHKRLKGVEYVWCATKSSAVKIQRSSCDNRNGKVYTYEHQAKAEHKRLKGVEYVWCATNLAVWKLSSWSGAKDSCRKTGGKIFPSQYQAEAEFRRLSTASSSGKVWCATKTAYFVESSESACQSLDGKHYAYNSVGLSSAKAEHKRLKGSSSSSTTTTASSSTLSEEAKKKYIDWAKSYMPAYDVALAIASNTWAGGRGKNVHAAKRAALDNCEKHSKGQTCKIIDVNLTTISSSSSSSFLKIGFIIAAVIVVLVFLGRLGKRSWQSPRTKTTGWPAPAREVAQPQPKVTPPARPKVEAPPKEDPRERLVGIDPSWSIDRKLKYVRAKFVECNDRLAILSEGPERTRLLEILNACGALKRKYES